MCWSRTTPKWGPLPGPHWSPSWLYVRGWFSVSIQLSVVIPVLNEEESLGPLWEALQITLNSMGRSWEVIFCDDGSTDNSMAILEELAAGHSNLKIVEFRRNFGQLVVLVVGFDYVQGELIIFMDA
ncbi:MAG TPA: glycosyltransferase, partial [Myxococcales bacterium]|nr:glycosyltransferase [Myxococcales bacterium]